MKPDSFCPLLTTECHSRIEQGRETRTDNKLNHTANKQPCQYQVTADSRKKFTLGTACSILECSTKIGIVSASILVRCVNAFSTNPVLRICAVLSVQRLGSEWNKWRRSSRPLDHTAASCCVGSVRQRESVGCRCRCTVQVYRI